MSSARQGRFTLRAQSAIKPSTVVRLAVSGVGDFLAAPCLPNQIPFGIAENWTEAAPGTPFDTTFAASPNVRLMVWAPGDVAVAAVKQQTGTEFSGIMVGPNAASEIIFVTTGWAVGYLLEGDVDGRRARLRVFVHPSCLCTAQGSQS
jgi:hypothetical protein